MTPNYPQDQHDYIFEERPLVYAGFWGRFAAAVLDALILFFLNVVVGYVLSSPLLEGIVRLILGWLYAALQESGPHQATLGKRALGIKVIGTDGTRISFGRATARYFSKILSAIILFIGYLMMLWDDRKQTLHDKIADTLVVSAD